MEYITLYEIGLQSKRATGMVDEAVAQVGAAVFMVKGKSGRDIKAIDKQYTESILKILALKRRIHRRPLVDKVVAPIKHEQASPSEFIVQLRKTALLAKASRIESFMWDKSNGEVSISYEPHEQTFKL